MSARYKSKTLATWIALAAGSFGLHRFYLNGWRDVAAWLHPWPAFAGLAGVRRVLVFGQDDPASWVLLPLLGVMVAQGMLCAILYGLTPDDRWNARYNPGLPPRQTRWGPVLGAVAALMLGASVLMATIAFGSQRFFEWQVEEARKISQ
jgi:hypothetical protein